MASFGAFARWALSSASRNSRVDGLVRQQFDTRSPFQTSGIRLGTPAITTRGVKEDKMETIADMIDRVLSAPELVEGVEQDELRRRREDPAREEAVREDPAREA